jgi:hypothetical protein
MFDGLERQSVVTPQTTIRARSGGKGRKPAATLAALEPFLAG